MAQNNTQKSTVHIGRNVNARGRGPIQIELVDSYSAKDSVQQDTSDIDTKLGPLFRGLIEGAKLGKSLMSSDLYRLTFSPSATKALSDGTLSIVATEGGLRAWAVESGSHRIVEQGVLKSEVFSKVAKGAAIAGAAWQILAMITAQKYLADINRQLAAIKVGLEAIRLHLEEDRDGRLIGNLEYLRSHADLIRTNLLKNHEASVISNQLQSIERECTQIGAALKRGVQSRSLAFESEQIAHNADSLLDQKTRDRVQTFTSEISDYTRILMASLLARIIAVEQILVLDPHSALGKAHAHQLSQEIDYCEDLIKAVWEKMSNKVSRTRNELKVEIKKTKASLNGYQQQRTDVTIFIPFAKIWNGTRAFLDEAHMSHLNKAIAEAHKYEKIAKDELGALMASISKLRYALNTATSLFKGDQAPKGLSLIVQTSNGSVRLLKAVKK